MRSQSLHSPVLLGFFWVYHMKKMAVIGLLANFLFACVNLYLLNSTSAVSTHSEIVVNQIRIVDEKNKTKLVLSADKNEATITALDKDSTVRYQFSLTEDGTYTMLFDQNEEPRVGYFVKDQDNQVVHFADRVDEYTP